MKYSYITIILNGTKFDKDFFIKNCMQDFIIAADGGINYLEGLEDIIVDAHIGDMDSVKENSVAVKESIVLPKEKDYSDFHISLQYALDKGYKNIRVLAGLGGRTDHLISNIQTAAYFVKKGLKIEMISKNESLIFTSQDIELSLKIGTTVSIFSIANEATGVTLKGFKYKLENGTLYPDFPVGLSNIVEEEKCSITLKSGVVCISIQNKVN